MERNEKDRWENNCDEETYDNALSAPFGLFGDRVMRSKDDSMTVLW